MLMFMVYLSFSLKLSLLGKANKNEIITIESVVICNKEEILQVLQ